MKTPTAPERSQDDRTPAEWSDARKLAKRKTDPDFVRAVKAGCAAANIHLRCSFPDCSCKQMPSAILAALDA